MKRKFAKALAVGCTDKGRQCTWQSPSTSPIMAQATVSKTVSGQKKPSPQTIGTWGPLCHRLSPGSHPRSHLPGPSLPAWATLTPILKWVENIKMQHIRRTLMANQLHIFMTTIPKSAIKSKAPCRHCLDMRIFLSLLLDGACCRLCILDFGLRVTTSTWTPLGRRHDQRPRKVFRSRKMGCRVDESWTTLKPIPLIISETDWQINSDLSI